VGSQKKRRRKAQRLSELPPLLREKPDVPFDVETQAIFFPSNDRIVHGQYSSRDYKVLRSQKTPRVVTVIKRK
jgi:hypothetical protein